MLPRQRQQQHKQRCLSGLIRPKQSYEICDMRRNRTGFGWATRHQSACKHATTHSVAHCDRLPGGWQVTTRCLQIPKLSRGSAALQLANENIVQRTLIQHSMFPCANHQFSLKGSPKAQAHQAQPEPNKVPCINVINNLAALAVLHLKCEE